MMSACAPEDSGSSDPVVQQPSPFVKFPTLTIQPDWHEVVLEVLRNRTPQNFWFSVYFHQATHPSLHVTVVVQHNPLVSFFGNLEFKGGDQVNLTLLDPHRMVCQIRDPENPTLSYHDLKFTIVAPNLMFKAPSVQKWTPPLYSIDMNVQGTLLTSASEKGRIFIWNAADGSLNRTLEGHLGYVTKARFFPSGQVILSTSADMTARIWSATDGTCARILQGHVARVTDCAMLVRGKTVITSSMDGTVKLWEAASATELFKWDLEDPVLALVLREINQVYPEQYPPDYNYTSEADRYLGAFACASGIVRGFHLTYPTVTNPLFEVKYPYAANALCFLSATHLAVGYEDGMLLVWNLASTESPQYRAQVSTTAILQVQPLTDHRLVVSTADGLVVVFQLHSKSITLHQILSGNELDPLHGLQVTADHSVVAAGRDGEVRMYCC